MPLGNPTKVSQKRRFPFFLKNSLPNKRDPAGKIILLYPTGINAPREIPK